MEFNDISKLFGGTIFAEEHRGNLSQIKTEIERLESVHTSNHANDLGQRCLLKGLFEMLRGNYGTSQYFFNQTQQLQGRLNDKWRARLKLYEQLNLVFRLTPPLIRFRSNLGGSASAIRECALDAQTQLLAQVPTHEMTSIVEMCEFALIQVLRQAYIATWVSSCLHPQFAHAGLKASAEANKAELNDVPPAQMIDFLAMAEMKATQAYYNRLRSEINPRYIEQNSVQAFADVHNIYSETDDVLGLASHQVLLGDRILSPPFTSPIALNLIIEGQLTGWENAEWDKVEPSFCLLQNDEAEGRYAAALNVVRGVDAPRLRGAISLRRACILHMAAIQALSRGKQQEADALFSDAAANLCSAENDMILDDSHLHIISCHHLLLDISRGDHLFLENRASEIGAWGKRSGNTTLAQFLGLLIMRFGRRLYIDHARADLAQLCLRSAQTCFRTQDDEIYLLQSTLADAWLKHKSGHFAAAQVVIDTLRKKTRVLDRLRALSSKSAHCAKVLGLPIVNLFTYYNRIVSTVYSSANDINAIQSWREEYGVLKDELRIALSDVSFSDASGRPIDPIELLDETEAASELEDIFNDYMTRGYAALDEADLEAFEQGMEDYLAASTRIEKANDIRLTHNIIAYIALYDYKTARQLLPHAISSTFGGCARSLVASELRNVRLEGLAISNEVKIDFQAAERAISLCYLCQDWERGRQVLAEVERAFPELLSADGPTLDRTEWKFGVYIACIWEHNGSTEKAFSWYLWSLRSLQMLRTYVVDPDARRGMGWSIHNANLFAGLIRISLQFSRRPDSGSARMSPLDRALTAPDWRAQAFLFMEDSFARTLLELIIAHDDTGVNHVQSWAARLFLERQIYDLKSVELTQQRLVESLKANRPRTKFQQQERVLERLRKDIVQCEASLQDLNAEVGMRDLSRSVSLASKALVSATRFEIDTSKIFDAIGPDTAVVEINSSRGGLIILGITSQGVQTVYQSQTNELELRKYLLPYIKALRGKGVGLDEPNLVRSLDIISKTILGGLDTLLEQVDHLIFVPSSLFMSFPFGCLLYKGEPLVFRKAVSQVPSLAILERLVKLDAQNRESQSAKSKLFALVNSHQGDRNQEVPSVVFGALKLYRLFGTLPSRAETTDEAQFAAQYTDATVVHIGTHGHQSRLSPWQSYLSLKGQFKVMELAKLQTKAALVVFCACVSGTGRVTNANDVLGFSHAVLQSGAQNYLGALWKVRELETLLLMILFYSRLAGNNDDISIAKAWQHAQVSLYHMTKEEAVRLFKEAVTDWDHAEQSGINPKDFQHNGKTWLEREIQELDVDEGHFKNPYYWASFSLIGNAQMSLRWCSE